MPFRRGVEQGAEAVMAAHIELPALDAAPSTPATFSAPILHDLLRGQFGFRGLVYTDSMSMDAVAKMVTPGEGGGARAARRRGSGAALAGSDRGVRRPQSGGASGRITPARLDESVMRVLRAKASVGLHQQRAIDLDAVPAKIGGRAHRAIAQEASARSMTLVKDDRRQVPLTIPRDAPVLYLSVLDYPSGWQIAAPSRTFIPELKKRWPQVTAIEVSDHTPLSELDLVRAVAPRYGAIVASVFVRANSGSGRLDLSPEVVRLLRDLARQTDADEYAVRDDVLRQSVCGGRRAGIAGGAAGLRFLRSRRAFGGPRDRRRSAGGRAACRSRCPDSSRSGHGLDRPAQERSAPQAARSSCATRLLRDRLLARLARNGRRARSSAACVRSARHPRCAAGARAPPGGAGAGRRRSARGVAPGGRADLPRRARRRPGVYVLRDAAGTRALRREGHQSAAAAARAFRGAAVARDRSRRCRASPDAEWHEVGSELEALLREAALIRELQPIVNVQTGAPELDDARDPSRARPRRHRHRAVGRRRFGGVRRRAADGALDDPAHAPQRRRPRGPHTAADEFFHSPLRPTDATTNRPAAAGADRVFVAGAPRRGRDAARSARCPRRARSCAARLAALFATSGCFTSV